MKQTECSEQSAEEISSAQGASSETGAEASKDNSKATVARLSSPSPFSLPSQPALAATPLVQPGHHHLNWNRPVLRLLLVAGLCLLLLVPLALMGDVVRERSSLYQSVVNDISTTWGGTQWLAGPILFLPFTYTTTVEKVTSTVNAKGADNKSVVSENQEVEDYFVIFPQSLEMQIQLEPQERHRGIYRTLVYTADMRSHGSFALPSMEQMKRLNSKIKSVAYDRACIVQGITYSNALQKVEPLMLNGQPLFLEPGTQPAFWLASGFRSQINLSNNVENYTFSQQLSFSGSGGLNIMPLGELTNLTMVSTWPHPAFQGNVLPKTREISDQGFKAMWDIPSLARAYPNFSTLSQWDDSSHSHFSKSFNFHVGVDLFETSTHYHLIQKAMKYGILFISLTFLTFLIFEMSAHTYLHPLQYSLVGASMVVFYLLLLSFSEHVNFLISYAAAAGCTIFMISLYIAMALRRFKVFLALVVLLSSLYFVLYSLLRMEDYALLVGSALVLFMLGVLMIISRNINQESSHAHGAV